jgi:hypothetical protein
MRGFTGLVAVALFLYSNRQSARSEQPHPGAEDAGSRAGGNVCLSVATYQLKTAARIDDFRISAVDLLRQLPGVAQVEFSVRAERPTIALFTCVTCTSSRETYTPSARRFPTRRSTDFIRSRRSSSNKWLYFVDSSSTTACDVSTAKG